MNEIESALVLPKGAKPLNAYGRNYAFSGRDKVIATYLLPSAPLDISQGCDVMLEDGNSRPCTREEIAKTAKLDVRNMAAQTPAGKRRWYESFHSLPAISDGGCVQVSVEYDIVTRHVLTATCNGYA